MCNLLIEGIMGNICVGLFEFGSLVKEMISFKVFSIFNPGCHFVHKTFSFDRVYYGGYLSCEICFNI